MRQILPVAALTAAFAIAMAALPASIEAASSASYVASADPGLNPDANLGTADAWTVTLTDVGTGGSGSYLDGTRGWTIWSSPFGGDPATQTDASRADHVFTGGPLNVGDLVSMNWANSGILTGTSVGVSLTSGGVRAVTVRYLGGNSTDTYLYDDAGGSGLAVGQPFIYQSLRPFTFKLTSATSYSASFNGVPWSGTLAGAIDGIEVFNDKAADGSDTFFNNLTVAAVPEPCSLALAMFAGLCLVPLRRLAS